MFQAVSKRAEIIGFGLNGFDEHTIGFLMVPDGLIVPKRRSLSVGPYWFPGVEGALSLGRFGEIPTEFGHVGFRFPYRTLVVAVDAIVYGNSHVRDEKRSGLPGLFRLRSAAD